MKNPYKILIILTLVFTSFWLWIFYSQSIKDLYVKRILKTQNNPTKSNVNISRTNIIQWKLENAGIINTKDLDLQNFWEVYKIIKQDYYNIEDVKKTDLVNGLSKWLIEALGDKHSEFMTIQENENFSKMLSGDFEWIWAVVDKLDFWVKIERILKWSPAEKFWLIKDDIIIEANSKELADLNLYDAVAEIKWPAGTKVLLKVLRSWEREALEVEVVRDKIKIPSIEEKYFDEENIAYIALNMYWELTATEFKKALNNLQNKNPEGLIIDLRNNGGGYLISAVEILSEFIENWKLLVTTKYKDKFFNEVYNSANTGWVFDKKIVILINWSSASASEITAWALREYNKAIIVWEKSYWKGSVQKPFILDDGSMLKLTIAKWFTPMDQNIDKQWITPDIKVEIKKQDYNLEECKKVWRCWESLEQKDFELYDRQLEEAKSVLKKFILKGNLQVVVDEENERLWNSLQDKKNTEIEEE